MPYWSLLNTFTTILCGLSRIRGTGYWTEEVFTITKRVLRRPPVYKIADFDDEELKGTFYEQELQKVDKTESDFYRVEEILRSRMRNKRKEYFVKWLGYPDKFNSWVPAESVKDIK